MIDRPVTVTPAQRRVVDEVLAWQADLIVELVDRTDLPDADKQRVRSAHASRFGTHSGL